MKPQFQSPPGTHRYGDCHRTCIAMILDLDRDEVPHFMADVPPGQSPDHPESVAAEQAERDWLVQRGLTIVNVPVDGGATLEEVLTTLSVWARDAAVILGGVTSSGACHSVVVYRGMVYDPRVLGGLCTLTGPQPSGYWYVTIYAHATNPLRTEPTPVSVVTQEED